MLTLRRVAAMTALIAAAAASGGEIDPQWRLQFNVQEADPIAMTGAGVQGAAEGFEEPDALIFVKRDARRRGTLLGTDIRFTAGERSRSRLNLYDTAGPHKNGRMKLMGSLAEGAFVGKPKSIVENSKGQFIVSHGIELSDAVSDADRGAQGLHLFDAGCSGPLARRPTSA
jgi:hypothetical protein